jgi:hypothetical protein
MNKPTLIFVVLLAIVNCVLMFGNPWRHDDLPQAGTVLLLAVCAAALGWAAGYQLHRIRSRGAHDIVANFAAPSRGRTAARLTIVAVTAVIAILVWFLVAHIAGLPFLAVETGYYAILAAVGVLLAAWCRTGAGAALLVPTLMLWLPALLDFGVFVMAPENQYRLGPERFLFAMRGYLERMAMWPLDLAVVWSAWWIAITVRRTSRAEPRPAAPPAIPTKDGVYMR